MILLDTHVLIWLQVDADRLSQKAAAAIAATARVESLPLVTADGPLRRSPLLKTIW